MLPIIPTLIDAGTMGARPIFEKFAVSKVNRIQFTFIRYIFSGVISLILIFIFEYYKGNSIKSFYDFNHFKDYAGLATIISIFAIVELLANYYLIQNYSVYKVTAIISSLAIVINVLLSLYVLKEKMNFIRAIGILLIVIGIILLNCF